MVDFSALFPAGTDFERGGFWRRGFAWLIDLIIVCLLLQTVAYIAYPLSGGRIQFKDGFATLFCDKLDKVPDGITVPADFAPTSIKICRQGLFGLTAARIVNIQHVEPGTVTTFRQIVVQVDEEGRVITGPGLGLLALPLLFGFRLLLDLGRGTPGRRTCRVRLAEPNGEAPPQAARVMKRYALQMLPATVLYVPALAALFGFPPANDQLPLFVIGPLVCLVAGLGLALNTIIYRKETFYDRLAGLRVLRVDRDGVLMPQAAPAPTLLPPEIMGEPALQDNMPAMPPPLPEEPARNYVMKHWRGQYSLPFAYWVNGTVLGIGAGVALGAFAYVASVQFVGMPFVWFACMLAFWLVMILVTAWQVVGIWRSATRYRQSERIFWGGFAKCMMVFATLNLAYYVIATGVPQLRDIYGIARGDALVGTHSFHVADNGARLDFYGGISFGVAKELDEQLAQMDHVTTVLLNSQGGRIAEAQRMADIIRKRGLSTTVVNLCASACTIAFLGGKERTMTGTARLGFHQPNFGGLTDAARAVLIAQEEARLQRFGLSKDFAVRANQAPPQSMWYPDKAELLREHVVTAIIEPQPKPQAKPTGAPTPIATIPVREPAATAAPVATMPPTPATTSAPRARIPADVIQRLSKPQPAKGGVNAKTGAQQ